MNARFLRTKNNYGWLLFRPASNARYLRGRPTVIGGAQSITLIPLINDNPLVSRVGRKAAGHARKGAGFGGTWFERRVRRSLIIKQNCDFSQPNCTLRSAFQLLNCCYTGGVNSFSVIGNCTCITGALRSLSAGEGSSGRVSRSTGRASRRTIMVHIHLAITLLAPLALLPAPVVLVLAGISRTER